MKKYRLTDEKLEWCGRTLYRIKALRYFADVKKGDKGGWIEKEENLSHIGNAWVYGDSKVYENATVYWNAIVSGGSLCHGNALVSGSSKIYGNADVYGNSMISGDAEVFGNALVCGDSTVSGHACVFGRAKVFGNATVVENACVCLESDIFWVSNIGPRADTITVFKCSDGLVRVKCDCFCGTVKDFAARVARTHGDSKYAREYKALIELIKIHFNFTILN